MYDLHNETLEYEVASVIMMWPFLMSIEVHQKKFQHKEYSETAIDIVIGIRWNDNLFFSIIHADI